MCIRDRYQRRVHGDTVFFESKMNNNSISSTTCSTPTNDSVQKVIKNDTVRYRRKGYGLISASLIVLAYFVLLPQILKKYWAMLFAGIDHRNLVFFSTVLVHSLSFLIGNLGMWAVYHAKHSFFERYKISQKQWPWESDPERWRDILKRTISNLLVFHLLIFPSVTALKVYVSNDALVRIDTDTFPNSWEVIRQIIFCMFIEDFIFYWSHRLLHHPKIYAYIHKRHHEYVYPVSISSEYAHPIESILSNIIPSGAGIALLGSNMHLVTQLMWMLVRVWETIDGHCGYEFSWSPFRLLPLSGSAKYHEFHHSHNVGNYGSFFTIWDTLMMTNSNYFRTLAKKEHEESLQQLREAYINEIQNKATTTKLSD
eukprot:TRINITY_DN1689_c0_g1_i1.p1 TRINITY_DN1689_c0_g1~~TRINITY_DN1689_c0_g1_i1.p1  ORF type:complete len:369 (+),score=62.86 TRINITY_DN1689_c0_g1_i1:2-1108(+)